MASGLSGAIVVFGGKADRTRLPLHWGTLLTWVIETSREDSQMPDPEVTQPEPDAVPEPEAVPGSEAAPPRPEPPERQTIADAITEFVQMIVDYVRQETGDVVHDKVVVPTQKAGMVIAFAMAAALVMFLGIAFISVALEMVLAQFVGWPAALAITGGLLLAGAGGLSYAKVRNIQ